MENFTPVSGFLGGVLIGFAALVLLLFNGRIAGVSGILGGLLDSKLEEAGWRIAFLVGLIAGPFVVMGLRGEAVAVEMQARWPFLILAGLLVGYGTRLGGGCTSGHGVCGIPRGSKRSIVATLIFFAAALVTVYVQRHGMGG